MIVSELIDLLGTKGKKKGVGIQWGDDAEIDTWVEDLLLMKATADFAKFFGFGNRHDIIFLSTAEDSSSSITVGRLLKALSECKATATVAVTSSDDIDEESVGYVVGGVDWSDDVFALTAQRTDFIQRR